MSTPKIAFCFPGQGSLEAGMGREIALADARAEGRLREGTLVLLTGMGAGLTWGSALVEWTNGRPS